MKTRIAYYLAAAALLLSIAGSTGVAHNAVAAEASTSDTYAQVRGF